MNILMPELAVLTQRREKTRAIKQAMRQDTAGRTRRRGERGGETMSDEPLPQSEIILYQTEDGRTRVPC